jgi:CRP-like cAMP-binding protein
MFKKPLEIDIARQSNLLTALHPNDLQLFFNEMEMVYLQAGQVLYEPGDTIYYAYFPCAATLVSYMVLFKDGKEVETALIGREGAVGGIVSQGMLPAYCRCVVQFSGYALKIESIKLEKAKSQSPTLRYFFARYSDCLLSQVFQTVACNATHSISQRTAKWLLAALDRTGDYYVPLTQEQLSSMLGVGRSYIARIISVFKQEKILETKRGKLIVTDLDALKGHACECNELVREHFEVVLKGVYPDDAGIRNI